ncbi:glycosyltransferase family 4 protein [Paenibacillus sp. B2(2019)]|uniref:glycosyltransferase family 4 protein n=1 Tax=Paenibacillus sp. B2(2019) TaxID=2607754 RepID=UPI0011F11A1D|nr:glycosyltransferase family 4 protein [Paenibacillus sp. B2(2019)]KAA1185331.1 glycosyltransferase family 4 protein [Paenibacillus sp. B2(2019)]
MKVVIVTCFDTYEDRIDLLHEYFCKRGDEVTIIQSDFRHFKKSKRIEEKPGYIFVNTRTYNKNLSIARLRSHYAYAKKAFELVENLKPELLYAVIPANSIAKFAGEYKKNNNDIKLVFDLVDLWPETMPIGSMKYFPPFTFWRLMRDNSLKFADFIITECNLYQSILKDLLKNSKKDTVYLAKKEIKIVNNSVLNEREFHLCYLGSINNIIDIQQIKNFIKAMHEIKPTTLHIIGDGENRNLLIEEINSTGALVKYHSKLYDAAEKQLIFDQCHFGLNIMKKDVCVGLTMKSIDYFQHGLPIINNIQADTAGIVELYKIGFNLTDTNIQELVYEITNIDLEQFVEMRKNTKKVFNDFFSSVAFNKKMNVVIKELYE